MKKILSLAAIATALPAFTVCAADLAPRKGVMDDAPLRGSIWEGAYAGVNIGYNAGTNKEATAQNWQHSVSDIASGGQMLTPVGFSKAPLAMDGITGNSQSGFLGGGQVGYNYLTGKLLVGLEADIQGMNSRGYGRTYGATRDNLPVNALGIVQINDAYAGNTIGSTAIDAGVDYLGTVRGRLGYLVTPDLLVYETAGFAYGGAWAHVNQTATSTDQITVLGIPLGGYGPNTWSGSTRQSQILTGWTAGAGAEWMFMPNWSLKGEALYWNLGHMNINTTAYLSNGNDTNWGRTTVNYSGVMARAGLNYHLNFASMPIAAKF